MWVKAVLAVVGTVLALIVVEVGLRVGVEVRARKFVGSPVLTSEVVPDPLLVAWFKPNYASPDGKFSYDSLGLRENGTPRTEPVLHAVALLGGSTAYGFGLSDNQTISAYLEQDLQADASSGPSQAVVLNAGYPGLTTLDTLLVYHAKVAQLHPRTVILLAGLNDLYYASDWGPPAHRLYWINTTQEVALRARHDPALRPVVDAIDTIALRNCFTCYYLGTLASNAYDRFGTPAALDVAHWFGEQPMSQPNPRAMRLTAWAIQQLASWVHADGGCLVVAWQPIAGITSPAATDEERQAEAHVEERAPGWGSVGPQMLAELKADVAPVFASGQAQQVDLAHSLDGAPGPVWATDGVHYTALGDQRLAQALQPAMSSAGACGA